MANPKTADVTARLRTAAGRLERREGLDVQWTPPRRASPAKRKKLETIVSAEAAETLAELSGAEIRWRLGEDAGALQLPIADRVIAEGMLQAPHPDYRFPDGTRFLPIDFHVGDAMTYLVKKPDGSHAYVFADAAEEDRAATVATELSAYLAAAIESDFASHWPRPSARLASGKSPADLSREVAALPLRRDVEVSVLSVTPLSAHELRVWRVGVAGKQAAKKLAKLLGTDPEPDAIAAALSDLSDLDAKTVKGVAAAIGQERATTKPKLSPHLAVGEEGEVGVRIALKLKAKQLFAVGRQSMTALLLDAPGGEKLADRVRDVDRLRFDDQAFDDDVLGDDPPVRAVAQVDVTKKLVHVVVVPDAVPEGCVEGATWKAVRP